MAGCDDAEVELLALFEDVRPNVVGVERGIVEIDFETDLGRKPGPGDRDAVTVQLVVEETVLGKIPHVRAEHLFHQRGGFWALHLEGRNIDLVDVDVEFGERVDALSPE